MADKLRVFVLTEGDRGMASRCLPELATASGVEVVACLLVEPVRRKKWRLIKKVFKIGLLGALNGIRMRKWYIDDEEPLDSICGRLGIRLHTGLRQNSVELQQTIEAIHADLGLSLGNGFISRRIFEVPRYGMLNVHSEVLPAYQNAQSIIWPIYCNDPYTGFTIHEIERKIDAGRILYQTRLPITFEVSIEQTVRKNRQKVEALIPKALAEVCSNFDSYRCKATKQENGRTYTTPSIWSFLKMLGNNRRFYRVQCQCGGAVS